MPYLVALLVFTSVVFLVLSFLEFQRFRKSKLQELVEGEDPAEALEGQANLLRTVLSRVGKRYAGNISRGKVLNIEQKLQHAGYPYNFSGEEFYVLRMGTGFVMFFFAVAFSVFGAGGGAFLLFMVLGLIALVLPDKWLDQKVYERKRQISNELMNFVDVLAICAEAGLPTVSAIERAAEHYGGILGKEFKQALREVETGKSRSEALSDLAERNGTEELEQVVNTINQAEAFGANIAETLRGVSYKVRDMRRNRAHEKANQGAVKIYAPIYVFIFLPLFVIILAPLLMQVGGTLGF